LLETPERSIGYNMIGNDECECFKTIDIGQSAAKPIRNSGKVQRLTHGVWLFFNKE